MKLSELKLIQPDVDGTAELRKKLVDTFHFDAKDADEVAEFLNGEREWEELTTTARDIIFSHYEKRPGNTGKIDPETLLKKDFK